MRKTATFAILEQLAEEHRRVLSDWRALVLWRRATFETPQAERRWTQLATTTADLYPLFRQMRGRGEIRPISGLRHLYEVTVPYARGRAIDETEVLMEASPYAALSHLSALVFHGLTEDLPQSITAMVSTVRPDDLLPLGTEPRDWEGLPPAPSRTPSRILGRSVGWAKVKPERYFGVASFQPRGFPVRVTTPERTLLDGLLAPELCGGSGNVLRAWVLARDTIDIDVTVSYVERFKVGVLRQRAGFVLDELALRHSRLEHWRSQARRGGSSRLVASASYAPAFSERWSLSLNAPVAVLHEDRQ